MLDLRAGLKKNLLLSKENLYKIASNSKYKFMGTFLAIVGIFALFIFFKFIYDSYLTKNTEKDWNDYASQNPEDAARIERNKGLDFNTKTKSNERDKKRSLERMAQNNNCLPEEVKEVFLKGLKQQGLLPKDEKLAIQRCKQMKYEEAIKFNIDPDDTIASFMEKWTIEYFSISINDNKPEIKDPNLNKYNSLKKLANEYNCNVCDVKRVFVEYLKNEINDFSQLQIMLSNSIKFKNDESISQKISSGP